MLVLTVLHDLSLGARMPHGSTAHTDGARQWIVWLARVNLIVVLGILLCGIWLTES